MHLRQLGRGKAAKPMTTEEQLKAENTTLRNELEAAVALIDEIHEAVWAWSGRATAWTERIARLGGSFVPHEGHHNPGGEED